MIRTQTPVTITYILAVWLKPPSVPLVVSDNLLLNTSSIVLFRFTLISLPGKRTPSDSETHTYYP
jgi:hypothetical protein